MVNEKTWDENFNWFSKEHYECHKIDAASRDAILTAFRDIFLSQYPNKDYGTALKDITNIDKNKWVAIVKRFKTIDLFKKHCLMPPTYIRVGEMNP